MASLTGDSSPSLPDHRHQAGGGDGHVPVGEVGAVAREEQVERHLEVPVVGQRLAHPHEDEVGEGPGPAPLPQLDQPPVGPVDLVHDLARGQVAGQPHGGGEAELAADRAADLGGDAERLARQLGQVDRLEQLAVLGPPGPLDGAVHRALLARPLQGGEAGPPPQLLAQRPGEVGHLLQRGRALLVQPAVELAGPERALPQAGEQLPQQLERQRPQVGALVAGGRVVPQGGWLLRFHGRSASGRPGHDA